MTITGFDHFIVVVNSLEIAMETYRRLGFGVCPGGEHRTFGSHNALVPLSDGTYIELVAFKDAALAARSFWAEAFQMLQVCEGFAGFAISSDDIVGDVRRLRNRGIEITGPQPGERTRLDGRRVAWRTAIMRQTASGTLPFLIQDETPRALRVGSAAEGFGNGARVEEVTVAVGPSEPALSDYCAVLNVRVTVPAGSIGEGKAYRLQSACGSIVLAHSPHKDTRLAHWVEGRGEGLYSVTLSVEDLEHVRRYAAASGWQVQDDGAGFLLPPDLSCGARIQLIQRDREQ